MKDTNWLWKPPHGVESQIQRGNKTFDLVFRAKLIKRAEAIGFRDRRAHEDVVQYDAELKRAEKAAQASG